MRVEAMTYVVTCALLLQGAEPVRALARPQANAISVVTSQALTQRLTSRFSQDGRSKSHLLQARESPVVRSMRRRAFLAGVAAVAPVAAMAQAPAKPPAAPVVFQAVIDHLKAIERRGDPVPAEATLRTVAYWAAQSPVGPRGAAIAVQFMTLTSQQLSVRLKQAGGVMPASPLAQLALLRQFAAAILGTSILTGPNDPKVKETVFIQDLLPLLFEEEVLFARQSGAAPSDLLVAPLVRQAAAALKWPRMEQAVGEWSADVRKFYAVARANPGRVVGLQRLNHALQERDYISYSTSKRTPTGRWEVPIALYRRLPESAVIYRTNEIRTRVSDVALVWRVGTPVEDGHLGGFNLPEIENEVYVEIGEWERVAEQVEAVLNSSGEGRPAGARWAFWHPLIRIIALRELASKTRAAIRLQLRRDVVVHEVLHRWFRAIHSRAAATDLFDLFAAHVDHPTADRLYMEYAAMMGTVAFTNQPLWNVMHWIFALPEKEGTSSSPEARLSDRLIRDLVDELEGALGEPVSALLSRPAPLTRGEGLALLEALNASALSTDDFRKAARAIYTRRVGPLFPGLVAETGMRAMAAVSGGLFAALLLRLKTSPPASRPPVLSAA